MSTRGCVAIGTPENWRGVYNHWDSYPTGLGQQVWQHLHTVLSNSTTLDDFSRALLRYDDWRAYLNKGTCEYCGKKTSQPHSISGLIACRSDERFKTKTEMRAHYDSLPGWQERHADIERAVDFEWQIRRNIKRTGHPDPDALFHEHDTRPPEEQHITSDNPDPLFIEWVYVIDPTAATLHVLMHTGIPNPTRQPYKEKCRSKCPGRWDYGHCLYWHEPVGSFPINGLEPDWETLE